MKYNNKQDIRNELEDILNNYKASLGAWKSVKRLSKKDGSDYAYLSKNFTNCKIVDEYNLDQPELKVSYSYGHKYSSDELPIYGYTDELSPSDTRYRKSGFSRCQYILTVDELFIKINERISVIENEIKSYEFQLSILDKYFEKAQAIMNSISELKKCDDLNENTNFDFKSPNSLCYALITYIKEWYY